MAASQLGAEEGSLVTREFRERVKKVADLDGGGRGSADRADGERHGGLLAREWTTRADPAQGDPDTNPSRLFVPSGRGILPGRRCPVREGMSPAHVKVLFYVEEEDGTVEVESMGAVPEADGYRLDNIPFFARSVALGDLVAAEVEADGALRYTGLIAASGHSTIRVLVGDPAALQGVRDALLAMGCDSERWKTCLIDVDIPPAVAYATVQAYLEGGVRDGVFEYEEGCLAGQQE